jgi:proteasome lid subunit RPN8/RPN11
VFEPGFGRWSAPQIALSIKYRRVLIEEIRTAGRGILFGTHAGNSLRIVRWRPIVSENDNREFVRLLLAAKQDPELQSLQPVGWFVSHPGGDLSLSASDQEIFDQYFSEPWQVTLVLAEGARAGVVVRSGGNCQASVLDPPAPAKAQLLRLLWAIPTLIAMILAGALIRPQHPAPVNPGMFLRIQGDGPALQINWDTAAVRGARSGEMEIQDGGQRSVVPLTGAQLGAGKMSWHLQSGDVQVRMTVHPAGGGDVREFARYRLATVRAPAPSPAPDPHADELKKLSDELHQERVRSEKLQNMVKILENRLEIDTSRGK